ncbi:MsnO8 family LLM class oxidoreductase [Phycicoccus sp. BSK3Z-2]|uniref:MsnO8 family LLM class oxidoreductase n=1 Tax=Phycicoccus avicenniae TaxID=2828860 RepID=A0A941D565_9MICO|nr:MsnO8 family LLM class oxidoreductase [Phycicoccus avicenniae]MBR7741871.1 MsnO8 family LLM class oxidoreductase [Phycicoccus avicenniae]
MRLSLLDRSRTRAGEPDALALRHTVDRAVRAEAAGFHRFWVAEHHAVPGVASGSPPLLVATIGSATSRIRIGSGGVMLPLHQPLVVAEQFLMLQALHPGRVDLGIGRSLGFTPPVRRALRRESDEPDTFREDLQELRSYLDGEAEVTARPSVAGGVPVFVLATGRGVRLAAELGLPVVVGGPVLDADELPDMLAEYRRSFQPAGADRATVVVSVDVLVADDEATARRLALPEAWASAQARRTGSFPPLESPDDIETADWGEQVRRRVEEGVGRTIAGTAATVRCRLERLVERSGADGLMASSSTFDLDALHASDRMLHDVVG